MFLAASPLSSAPTKPPRYAGYTIKSMAILKTWHETGPMMCWTNFGTFRLGGSENMGKDV